MTDFEKICEILKEEPTREFLEELINCNIELVIQFNEDGNLECWGTV